MDSAASQVPDDVRLNQTYAHRFARILVRPLLGTWVRPTHITWLRLLVGILSCACFAIGSMTGDVCGGVLWLVCCVLDRADGELARMGDMRSESGRILDFYSDLILDSLWFLAAGIGARRGGLGDVAIVLGAVTCAALFVCNWMAEEFEKLSAPGVKAYYGTSLFHPDDALFLLPLFVWVGWQTFLLCAACTATVAMALVITSRYLRLRGMKKHRSG